MNPTFSVSLKPSFALALCLTLVSGAAMACAWVTLPLPAFALLAAGVALAWIWHSAGALQLGAQALRALEFDAMGEARLQDGRGLWHPARLRPGSYVSRWLIVLMFEASGRRRALVLLEDAAGRDELRRLRVWLRWRGAQS